MVAFGRNLKQRDEPRVFDDAFGSYPAESCKNGKKISHYQLFAF
jgi:hypothetical protein